MSPSRRRHAGNARSAAATAIAATTTLRFVSPVPPAPMIRQSGGEAACTASNRSSGDVQLILDPVTQDLALSTDDVSDGPTTSAHAAVDRRSRLFRCVDQVIQAHAVGMRMGRCPRWPGRGRPAGVLDPDTVRLRARPAGHRSVPSASTCPTSESGDVPAWSSAPRQSRPIVIAVLESAQPAEQVVDRRSMHAMMPPHQPIPASRLTTDLPSWIPRARRLPANSI